jgi:hypothetical protein
MSSEGVLHGRDTPLRTLREALAAATTGRGRLAIVSGEAGIGKSALASALAHDAEESGFVVTWGRAWEFADAPPYFPVWPCLRSLGLAPEMDAFRLWEGVALALARSKPTVWILEDLHAADLGTLDLLAFLAQPLRALPVLVLATVRSNDPRLTDRMMQRLTRIVRDGLDIRLEPLRDLDIAALTEETIGRAVPASALKKLAELTGGNPLFVVECARAFRAAGGIEGTLGSLPPTIRQVVVDRVAHLPDSTRDALACGAILGREFSAALVGRMQKALPARVIDTLLAALRAGIVTETRPGHFVFSHALVRDAIDESLPAEERASLHARAEAALASQGDSAEVVVERARHALLALRAGGEAHTLALASRAIELLERGGAFDRAFDLHVRVDESRRAGLLPPATTAELLHFASIARAAGRSDVMRRICEEAIDAARALGDAGTFARAALLYTSDVQPGVVVKKEVALLEEARSLVGDSIPTLACRLLARHATALQPCPDQELLMRMTREAIAKAHATEDSAAILDVLELAWWGLYNAPLEERMAVASELLERALAANDIPKALLGLVSLALHEVEAGDFDAFDRDVARALTLADDARHPRHRWRPLLLAGMRALSLGHFGEAERWIAEVEALAALVDDAAFAPAFALNDLMRKRLLCQDPREIYEAMARAEVLLAPFANASLFLELLRAMCAARLEDVERTRQALAVIGARLRTIFGPTMTVYAAEACALAGTDDDRKAIRTMLAGFEQIGFHGGPGPFVFEGTRMRLLGLLDASLGDRARAEDELREAYRFAHEHKQLPWIAQTAYELAKVVTKEADARALREECIRIAQDLGMTDLVRRARERSGASAPIVPASRGALPIELEKKGNLWHVAHGARRVTVKDSRGMQLLARLVERPDEEVHVLTLASDETANLAESNAGEVLDERARAQYKERLIDLEEDLAEARRNADTGRATKLEDEKEALLTELGRAVGLGGRRRVAASATERARVNVQRRLKDAIARIAEADSELGRFFERGVRTGTFCCFRP